MWMENPVLPSSCVTPAGTCIEVQNEWEENTQNTHAGGCVATVVSVKVGAAYETGGDGAGCSN